MSTKTFSSDKHTLVRTHAVHTSHRYRHTISQQPVPLRRSRRRVSHGTPFPLELYRNIIEWITDTEDLYNLSLTSRICCVEAERVLYRSIDLPQNSTTPVLWAATIIHHPTKAERVRSLTLRFDTSFLIVPDMMILHLRAISQALRKLINLKRLILKGHSMAMMHPVYTWILDGCPFKLEVFHNSVFPAPSVISFLSEQPSIRDWRQAGSHVGRMLDGSFLPHLAALDAHCSVLTSFTTCRPLTQLRVKIRGFCSGEREQNVISSLSLFGSTLRALFIERAIADLNPIPTDVLGGLAESTPHLRLLSLNDFPFPDPQAIEPQNDRPVTALARFKSLECLVLSELNRVSRILPRRRIATAKRLMEACATLRFVVISGAVHYLYERQVDGVTERILDAEEDDIGSLYAVHMEMSSRVFSPA